MNNIIANAGQSNKLYMSKQQYEALKIAFGVKTANENIKFMKIQQLKKTKIGKILYEE